MDREIILIAHNLRSSHNVGSIFRTADGTAVNKLYLSGITPYPKSINDKRLPHQAEKTSKQIAKTALGAEKNVNWEHCEDINALLAKLKKSDYAICCLEQTPKATQITDYNPPDKLAVIIGNEVDGIDQKILNICDDVVEIPMLGKKESLNVAQATAMILYRLRFLT